MMNMKKLIVILMLAILTVAGMATGPTKYGVIRTGYTQLSKPMAFTAADSTAGNGGFHILTADSLVILVTNLQKVKDALVNSVIYCQALEKQNDNLNALIKKVADDLKKVTTIEQLDSLKVVYGIEPKKLTKNGSNK
jgi:hypothetical protein